METTKVIGWVDIQAPLREVYDAVLDVEKRMQLSPLWGVTSLENIDETYPEEGSSLSIRMLAPPHINYRSIVTRLEPLKQFAYRLTVDRETRITWYFRNVSVGTRLTYEEEFLVDPREREDFTKRRRQG